jgi:transcriptional regulator with XRE-family HTH domain
MDLGPVVRMLRRRRRLNQREFAAIAGVPRSTIDRIESGRCDPRFSTMVRLAGAAGLRFVLVDRKDREVVPDDDREHFFDRAGRHFPAHLAAARTPEYMEVPPPPREWWGWHHVAFPPSDDKNRPENTYWRRRKRWPQMWNDAT